MNTHAFICGCSGLELTADETAFIREAAPWGLILFRRNIDTPEQVKRLTSRFRELTRANAPVLIDQEGGRVQRMAAPHWPVYPSAQKLTSLGRTLEDKAALVAFGARLMAEDLRAVGVSVDCLPVLDLPAPGAHSVIGDRAYGDKPETVSAIGRAAAEGLMAGGVLPVMKHIPGHGRARCDSHFESPIVDAPRAELERHDFAAFRANADLPMAMTAHVVFEAIDPTAPATLSPIVVREIIRGLIGFNGLLMSDDLSMKALSGSMREKTRALFAAEVDMALHCNGDIAEAQDVAAEAPLLTGRAADRANRALAHLQRPISDFDLVDARAKFAAALAQTA